MEDPTLLVMAFCFCSPRFSIFRAAGKTTHILFLAQPNRNIMRRNLILIICLLACTSASLGQNPCNTDAIVVEAFNYGFDPQVVNLEVGQSISWVNIGGNHDSQAELNSITDLPFNNPDSWDFPNVSGNANGVCIGTFTFVVPGVYQYDCSVGNHAQNGMVGTVIVGIGGCTDSNASNYNANADYDDGTCLYEGCTNPTACNYDLNAETDDGSCTFPGCMDPEAVNYDSEAGCESECLYGGCIDVAACNFDEEADVDDGSCTYPGCLDDEANNYDENAGCPASCTYDGCMDQEACNFNPLASVEDGSCTYPGCTNPNAANFDPLAGCDDGLCLFYANDCLGDLNYDSQVSVADLLILLTVFGNTCLPE
jgi:plastocyanin